MGRVGTIKDLKPIILDSQGQASGCHFIYIYIFLGIPLFFYQIVSTHFFPILHLYNFLLPRIYIFLLPIFYHPVFSRIFYCFFNCFFTIFLLWIFMSCLCKC